MSDESTEVRKEICRICDVIKEMLVAKNMAYGNSAIDPLRVFSESSPIEQLNVRIDDKLSRIARGKNKDQVTEDTELDLIGYLILKRVAINLTRAHV